MKRSKSRTLAVHSGDYEAMLDRVVRLIEEARRASARTVNAIMTGTYWLIGRHIVEFEQRGKARAEYGAELIEQLAADLSQRYGGGFSRRNVAQMRLFYSAWPILQTLSAKSTDLSALSSPLVRLRSPALAQERTSAKVL